MKDSQEKGLSLLELILAMTVMGFILIAGFGISFFASRLTAGNNETVQLRNELNYVFDVLDKSIRDGYQAEIAVAPDGESPWYELKITKPDPDNFENSIDVTFHYDFSGQRLTQIFNSTSTVISEGVLLPPYTQADFDHDEDIDLADVAFFDACQGNPSNSGCQGKNLDFDRDGNVTLADRNLIVECFYSAGQSPLPACTLRNPFKIDGRVVQIAFSAGQITPEGKFIFVPGVEKSILLRLTAGN